MNPIEFLKKANTVLVSVLLVGTLVIGGYLINRSRKPIACVHVAIDSARMNNK
jgi:hypothetical protein